MGGQGQLRSRRAGNDEFLMTNDETTGDALFVIRNSSFDIGAQRLVIPRKRLSCDFLAGRDAVVVHLGRPDGTEVPDRFLGDHGHAIAQIQDDQHSKELLRSLVDDEMSSIKWLMESCETLSK